MPRLLAVGAGPKSAGKVRVVRVPDGVVALAAELAADGLARLRQLLLLLLVPVLAVPGVHDRLVVAGCHASRKSRPPILGSTLIGGGGGIVPHARGLR